MAVDRHLQFCWLMKFKVVLLAGIAGWFLQMACSGARTSTTVSSILKAGSTKMPVTDSFVSNLLHSHPQYFGQISKTPEAFNVQIIYTQINRDKTNRPSFDHHFYNLNPNQYFYPASTVKMPIAFLALQKINELKVAGLSSNTTMITEAAGEKLTAVVNDPSAADGRPTIAHYIKKIFLASDNDASNRLYEFLGQEYINNTLQNMGYDSVQILHRLSLPVSEEENRISNAVNFYDDDSQLIYRKPVQKSNLLFHERRTSLGTGYYSADQLVQRPFDFSRKNRLPLADLHNMLTAVIFPEAVEEKQRFTLTPNDYDFLYRHMSMMPKESAHPQYDSSYSDAYVKFLLFGGGGAIENKNLRIFNKVGDAYGFLTDAAYIVDFANGVEFLLSATIYCNSDGIFNDDKYDYDAVGFPFMKNLGKVIYDYELKRKKIFQPDLSRFKFQYNQ